MHRTGKNTKWDIKNQDKNQFKVSMAISHYDREILTGYLSHKNTIYHPLQGLPLPSLSLKFLLYFSLQAMKSSHQGLW